MDEVFGRGVNNIWHYDYFYNRGALFCWIPIWMGILLFQTGKRIETIQATGQKILLIGALFKLKTYFSIAGILLLILLIAILIGIVAGGGSVLGLIEALQ